MPPTVFTKARQLPSGLFMMPALVGLSYNDVWLLGSAALLSASSCRCQSLCLEVQFPRNRHICTSPRPFIHQDLSIEEGC